MRSVIGHSHAERKAMQAHIDAGAWFSFELLGGGKDTAAVGIPARRLEAMRERIRFDRMFDGPPAGQLIRLGMYHKRDLALRAAHRRMRKRSKITVVEPTDPKSTA